MNATFGIDPPTPVLRRLPGCSHYSAVDKWNKRKKTIACANQYMPLLLA